MITTRLIRIVFAVVVVAVVALAALEVHWSMDAKNNARAVAVAAAAAGARELATTHDSIKARHVAEARASAGGAQLVSFTLTATNSVIVTVNRRARSYLLRRLPPTRSMSDITVSATAAPQ